MPDEVRGLGLYYRATDLAPGAYAVRLGRDCGSEGATMLGTVEAAAIGVASGRLLLDAIPSAEAAAGQVLMVMNDANRPVACGPVTMVNVASAP